MNRATRAAAAVLGIFAGLLAIIHGIFEILQGSTVTTGGLIQAAGPACQPEAVWHACLPAFTLIPNFLISGIAAVILGTLMLVWSVMFTTRKFASLGLAALSIGLVLVGGGFVPGWLGILASITSTQIRRPAMAQRLNPLVRLLARLWPLTALVLAAWFPLSWLLGALLPRVMVSLRLALFILFDALLPLLTAVSGAAYDRVKRSTQSRNKV